MKNSFYVSRSLARAAFVLAGLSAFSLSGVAEAQPAAAKPAESAPAVAAPLAIVAARIHTGTGEILDNATILIEKGVIQKVEKNLAAPSGVRVIDAKGAEVTPGFVDALTATGLVEVSQEASTHDDDHGGKDAIRAAFRAADGYNPASSIIRVTRLEGITSVGVVPSGGLFSGQSAWADLDGETADVALGKGALALHCSPKSGSDDHGSPAAALLRIREAFDDARTFQKNRAAWERNQSRPMSASRLDLEALADALAGKVPVVFGVDRASDILAVLALAKDFGIRPVIAGGAEAWKVAPQLAAAKVPVMVNPLAPGPSTFDALGTRDDNAALLHAAGVLVVVTTGDTHNARKLRQLAGNAVRAGMPHEAAIVAITRAPAEALGMGDRYGTIAKGKVANLVVWSGDPLEVSTRAISVVIRGKEVDLSNRQTALFDRYRKLPASR